MPGWKQEIRERLTPLSLAPTREAEIVEELAQHLEDRYAEMLSGGATPEEAFRAALAELSESELLTQGLGLGANTAIFSLVNTVLLRPLPVERPDRLVTLNNAAERRMFPAFSYPNYKDFRDRNDVFSGLFGYRFAQLSLSHDGVNERLWGFLVTGNYFETLGVKAALGRVISADDDRSAGAHPVAVVSYQCWRQRFGGEPGVIRQSSSLAVEEQLDRVAGRAVAGAAHWRRSDAARFAAGADDQSRL